MTIGCCASKALQIGQGSLGHSVPQNWLRSGRDLVLGFASAARSEGRYARERPVGRL